jgi:hypothetical protein
VFGYWKTTINGEFKENNGLEDEFEWLNNFYELIILYRRTDLFDEYNIIPNRYGSFSIINRKTKNANNVVISSIPILLNDDVKDETLLNIYGFLEFNQRRNFVSEHVTQIITPNKITKAEIANKIADVLKKLKDTTEEQNKGIRLLMEWLEYNPEEGKELFSELYAKRAELFMQTISDKESLYSLMKSKTPLSTLVEIAEAIENDPTILKLIEDRKQEKIEELIRNKRYHGYFYIRYFVYSFAHKRI